MGAAAAERSEADWGMTAVPDNGICGVGDRLRIRILGVSVRGEQMAVPILMASGRVMVLRAVDVEG